MARFRPASLLEMLLPRSAVTRRNVGRLRASPVSEASGSLGDLGTLLPLMMSLALTSSISLSTTLIATGVFNVLTGLYFGVPLPVQPMKAIAATAIATSYPREVVAMSGIFMGAFVLLLSGTHLLSGLARRIPLPITKGIQAGAGLSLILSAGTAMLARLHWTMPSPADNLILFLACCLCILLTSFSPARPLARVPTALFLLLLGVVLSALTSPRPSLPQLTRPHVVPVPFARLFNADTTSLAFATALGQLPLTLLNSIVAVLDLTHTLIPDLDSPITPTTIGFSIAAMNLSACWFGSMPVCHGSGGLAGQWRFGARSGSSVVLLGLCKLTLGLFFGDSLLPLLERFPKSVLAAMVITAGVELAAAGVSLDTEDTSRQDRLRQELTADERKKRRAVMLVTVAGILAFKNDGAGFLAGLVCHMSLEFGEFVDARVGRGGVKRDEEGGEEGEALLAEETDD